MSKNVSKTWVEYNSHVKTVIFFSVFGLFIGLFIGCYREYIKSEDNNQPFKVTKVHGSKVKNKSSKLSQADKNLSSWIGSGFSLIQRLECNNCERACWLTKGDKGGITCIGLAMNHNPKIIADILSNSFSLCKGRGIYVDWSGKDPFGKIKDICYYLRKVYWKNYVSQYSKCSYKAMIWLSDTAILQGERATNKILQRSHGLKVDGIFGKMSLKACQSFNFSAYKKERIATLRTYRDFYMFGVGWLKRLEVLDEQTKYYK